MPRDPSTTHPEDEQAQDERDHHIDDPFDVVTQKAGEELDDDDLDDLFDLDDLDDLDDEDEEGEGPDA